MAHIIGYPTRKNARKSLYGFSLMLGIAVLTAALMFDPSGNRSYELLSSLAVCLGIIGVLLFVYMRIDPLGFKFLIAPKKFEVQLSQDMAVANVLDHLGQDAFVFHGFVFELFRVEHLVVSRNGIFVISKIREPGDIIKKNGVLYCGNKSLETLTANTWRICHLIAIVLRKYFNTEYMPKPVLVIPNANRQSIEGDMDMALLKRQDLVPYIEGMKQGGMDDETMLKFTDYIRKRYASRL